MELYLCPWLSVTACHSATLLRVKWLQGNCKWWREHFKDHPKLKSKVSPDAAEALAAGKPKVMCPCHLDYEIAMIQQVDQIDVDAGLRVVVCDVDQIEAKCKY